MSEVPAAFEFSFIYAERDEFSYPEFDWVFENFDHKGGVSAGRINGIHHIHFMVEEGDSLESVIIETIKQLSSSPISGKIDYIVDDILNECPVKISSPNIEKALESWG